MKTLQVQIKERLRHFTQNSLMKGRGPLISYICYKRLNPQFREVDDLTTATRRSRGKSKAGTLSKRLENLTRRFGSHRDKREIEDKLCDFPISLFPAQLFGLRSVLGQAELDELLSQRDKLNLRLQEIIDRQTDPWGIKDDFRAADRPATALLTDDEGNFERA
jgi:hypothetical protein